LPLHIGDYLADTMHLTTEQHGAYLLLLMAYWKNQGPLPDDAHALAAIARIPYKKWSRIWGALESFFVRGNGVISNRRSDHEIDRAISISSARSTAGKSGATSRWHGKGNAIANGKGITTPQQIDGPSPSPLHKDTPVEEESLIPAREERAPDVDRGPKPELVSAAVKAICLELGIRLEDDARRFEWPGKIRNLIVEGLNIDRHLVPAARMTKEAGKDSIQYLASIARRLFAEEAAAHGRGKANGAHPAGLDPQRNVNVLTRDNELCDAQAWRTRMRVQLVMGAEEDGGGWRASWGPAFGQPGNLAPPDVQAEFVRLERDRKSARGSAPRREL
jgi:uncharacterized protein YdaU (DUF1376 family)